MVRPVGNAVWNGRVFGGADFGDRAGGAAAGSDGSFRCAGGFAAFQPCDRAAKRAAADSQFGSQRGNGPEWRIDAAAGARLLARTAVYAGVRRGGGAELWSVPGRWCDTEIIGGRGRLRGRKGVCRY